MQHADKRPQVYLKPKTHNRTTPMVIVFGHAEDDNDSIDALCAMVVTDCLVKPFEPATHLAAVEVRMEEAK